MDDVNLSQETLNQLSIKVARMREFNVKIAEDLTHRSFSDLEGKVFGYQQTTGMRQSTISYPDRPDEVLYTYQYSLGLKVMRAPEAEESEASEDEENDVSQEKEGLLEITAVFDVEYSSLSEMDQEDLDKFGERNVGYHVWPYWREFIQSSLARLDLPSDLVTVPFYFV